MNKEFLNEKKRKFEDGNYESTFHCPLCKEIVSYLFCYTHLKDCVLAYEEIYVKKSLTDSMQTQSILPIPSLSSAPHLSSPTTNSTLPHPPIIRQPKCALSGCNLSRQTPVFIKLKQREIKLCAFSHLKDGLDILEIQYPSDYFQISDSVCEKCGERVDYVIKISETNRKECSFELVCYKTYNFTLNSLF